MDHEDKKTKGGSRTSTLPSKTRNEDEAITIEVVSLKDMPLHERRKQASKPLYLTRYE